MKNKSDSPSQKTLAKLKKWAAERAKKTVFGEFGLSGERPMTDCLSRNNSIRPVGIDQLARKGIKHLRKR